MELLCVCTRLYSMLKKVLHLFHKLWNKCSLHNPIWKTRRKDDEISGPCKGYLNLMILINVHEQFFKNSHKMTSIGYTIFLTLNWRQVQKSKLYNVELPSLHRTCDDICMARPRFIYHINIRWKQKQSFEHSCNIMLWEHILRYWIYPCKLIFYWLMKIYGCFRYYLCAMWKICYEITCYCVALKLIFLVSLLVVVLKKYFQLIKSNQNKTRGFQAKLQKGFRIIWPKIL